jgi:hypothetical protein
MSVGIAMINPFAFYIGKIMFFAKTVDYKNNSPTSLFLSLPFYSCP